MSGLGDRLEEEERAQYCLHILRRLSATEWIAGSRLWTELMDSLIRPSGIGLHELIRYAESRGWLEYETRRVNHWLRLTPAGVELVRLYDGV